MSDDYEEFDAVPLVLPTPISTVADHAPDVPDTYLTTSLLDNEGALTYVIDHEPPLRIAVHPVTGFVYYLYAHYLDVYSNRLSKLHSIGLRNHVTESDDHKYYIVLPLELHNIEMCDLTLNGNLDLAIGAYTQQEQAQVLLFVGVKGGEPLVTQLGADPFPIQIAMGVDEIGVSYHQSRGYIDGRKLRNGKLHWWKLIDDTVPHDGPVRLVLDHAGSTHVFGWNRWVVTFSVDGIPMKRLNLSSHVAQPYCGVIDMHGHVAVANHTGQVCYIFNKLGEHVRELTVDAPIVDIGYGTQNTVYVVTKGRSYGYK